MMVADSKSDAPDYGLSEKERARVRAEMRYAMLVLKESDNGAKPKSMMEKALGFLTNGFVLLLVGSVITYFLVPRFQHEYDQRKQRVATMQECFSQFLLYGNSIWQEYYTILPLTQQREITKAEYLQYLAKIAEIKLRRYDAFAKVEALAVVFRDDKDDKRKSVDTAPTGHAGSNDKDDKRKSVDTALTEYARKVNAVSQAIDHWLMNLYCTPYERDASPCKTFDPAFDPFNDYLEIKNLVVDIGNAETESVAALMVKKINPVQEN